jgi:hypothetical protein
VDQILVSILVKLNDFIYELIWIPHCKAMVSKEQSLNIGAKQKKKKVKYKVNGRPPPKLRMSSIDNWKTWLYSALNFGYSWCDFLGRC